MKKTSLADIAKSVGVSKTLVSLVLNNRGDKSGISKETQEKVRKKAKELNYQPNQVARGLRTGKSNTIGIIVSDISNSFYARVVRSMEDAASKHGYHVIFSSSDENSEKELNLIELLRARQVDGLIISSSQQNPTFLSNLDNSDVPYVLFDRYIKGYESSYVGINNKEISYKMVSEMIAKGHRDIAILKISPGYISTIADRTEGYTAALIDNNIAVDNDLIIEIPFNSVDENVDKAIDKILKRENRVSAIFALNSNIAVACLQAFKRNSIKVPKDISIVSFDDRQLFKYCNPSVTAISQPVVQLAESAVDLVIDIINKKRAKEQIILPATIERRESFKEKKCY